MLTENSVLLSQLTLKSLVRSASTSRTWNEWRMVLFLSFFLTYFRSFFLSLPSVN